MARGEVIQNLVVSMGPCTKFGFCPSRKGNSGLGAGDVVEKSGCHDLICMLKRLIWLLGCEKVRVGAASQAEMTVVAVEG